MSKTVFITGASSGIGQAIAERFMKEDWNVVATMRQPEQSLLPKSDKLLVMKVDVSKDKDIRVALNEAIERFGAIDVLVNNAGFGLLGPIEALDLADIERQLDVNVYGSLRCIQQILPHFRMNNSGKIINISSMYGKISMPYFGIYAATKHAIEAISESLQQEIDDTNIRVAIIEPGAIKTKFFDNASVKELGEKDLYNPRFNRFMRSISQKGITGADSEHVASAVFKAANSSAISKRYVTDKTGRLLINLHQFTPFNIYAKLINLSST